MRVHTVSNQTVSTAVLVGESNVVNGQHTLCDFALFLALFLDRARYSNDNREPKRVKAQARVSYRFHASSKRL